MRIGIDCRSILHPEGGEYAGVGHYTYFLVKALLEIDRSNTYVLFFNHGVDCAPFMRDNVECVHFPFSQYRRYLPLVYNHLIVPQILALHHLDVYHNPANIVPLGYFRPTVITVHDLAIYKNPNWFPGRQWFAKYVSVPWSITRAKRIITVSDNTKTDLKLYFEVSDEKIKTVFHGVEDYSCRVPNLHVVREFIKTIPQPYFLYIGTIEPRKNLRRLIEAFALFVREHPDTPHRLVLAGKKGWKYKSVFRALQRLSLGDRVRYVGYISMDEKIYLLKHAFCFVFPSLYEGFGLPILEAMSIGLPLITSNVGSIPELVIDNAFLIDPYDRRSIARALGAALSATPESLTRLRSVGKNISQNFTWEHCARQTLEVYRDAGGKTSLHQ